MIGQSICVSRNNILILTFDLFFKDAKKSFTEVQKQRMLIGVTNTVLSMPKERYQRNG
tara:strand:+ start:507 stop:680 length:174 start_codon:yes stop_codon:yes gene_type:complete